MSETLPSTKFVGWARRNRRESWRAIVVADDAKSALFQLLDAVRGGDKIVLAVGSDPNRAPRPR